MRIIMRLAAKTDQVEALRAVLLAVARAARREPGCRGYQVMQNHADPTDFTLVEDYADQAALDAHLAAAHTQEAFAKGVPLLAAEPDMRRYSIVI
jgi:quinol monooxygenase YgiN